MEKSFLSQCLGRILRKLSALSVFAVSYGALSSCTFDDTALQNSIDDLTSRVEALEDFQGQVQGDIASLQDIISKLNSSVTVNNVVDNGDGSWTINFSDGTSVTIRNGQDGEDGLTPPSITVVEEDGTYYWAYENADGTTDFILDGDGNKIPVSGEAPRVRINEDGYWEISTDGGKTWKNTNVKAEGGAGDSFFSDVYVEDGILYLVLADGTVIEVPMTAELAFDFGTDESVLYFAAGESKTLEYTMSGAETYTITKPDGWRASIEGEGLVITAPAAENTFAETEGVVSVILFAANGQSFLAEQQVVIGSSQEVPEPKIGDYYYSDGTWSAQLDGTKEVIGLVFYTGNPSRDDRMLQEDFPGCTHGLVVSLKDLGACSWQQNYFYFNDYGGAIAGWQDVFMPEWPSVISDTGQDDNINKILGYNNTKVIEAFNADPANAGWPVNAVASVVEFREAVKAPETSSGWYLPSPKEIWILSAGTEPEGNVFELYGSVALKGRDAMNNILIDIPGSNLLGTKYYWTSMEYYTSRAFHFLFNSGRINYSDKAQNYNFTARAVLAF